jgi:uncharacterized protein YgiM (DUF1202 family)
MKLNVWIIAAWAPLSAVMVLAQEPAPTPAAGAGAPAAETAPAAPTKKASAVKSKVVLDPPATATVKSANVNVRGQASFNGETLGHLQKGGTVTVLEQITLRRPAKDEPAQWAQIALPADIPAWVNSQYVEAATGTIKAKRVNLRGGPGENYSLLGRLEKGASIKEVKREKGWVAIEAPTNAYAYVAAEFLEMLPPPVLAVVAPVPVPEPSPAPAPEPLVINVPPPAAAAAPAAATNEPAAVAPVAPVPAPEQSQSDRELEALHRATAAAEATAVSSPPAAAAAPAPAAASDATTPRVVTREGFVRRSINIQAPTDYELHDIQTGNLTEFLQPKAGQDFKIFVGTRVTITGTEGMVQRWPRTPVLQVQNVDLMP